MVNPPRKVGGEATGAHTGGQAGLSAARSLRRSAASELRRARPASGATLCAVSRLLAIVLLCCSCAETPGELDVDVFRVRRQNPVPTTSRPWVQASAWDVPS